MKRVRILFELLAICLKLNYQKCKIVHKRNANVDIFSTEIQRVNALLVLGIPIPVGDDNYIKLILGEKL